MYSTFKVIYVQSVLCGDIINFSKEIVEVLKITAKEDMICFKMSNGITKCYRASQLVKRYDHG